MRRHALPAAGIAVAVAAVAIAGVYQHRRALHAAALAAYDVDTAMSLAGRQVPSVTDSFYFFVLEHASDAEITELAEKLAQAATEHDYIGVTGADADYNRSALLSALAANRARRLDGLVIIYLGPPEHEPVLAPVVQASGAEFRFVQYVPEPDGSI
jgi:hypothetical protein